MITQQGDSTALLDQSFDVFPDLLFLVSSEGVILDYRGGQDTQLYTRPDAFLGRSLYTVLPPLAASRLGDGVERVSRTHHTATVDYTLPMPAGERTFEARLVPLMPDAVLAVCRDVSETRRVTAQPDAERRVVDARRTAGDDWQLLLKTQPNVLIEGPKTATEAALRRVLWHSVEPVVEGDRHPTMLVIRDVAKLPANEQQRLLGWIENGERSQILSTSDQSLYPLVAQGRFSADLYYRLNVVRLDV